MPVIYIDVLLALNLFIDFLLLSAVARILRLPPKRLRLVLGGIVGSACSCLMFLPTLPAPFSIIIKLAAACLIVRISFVWRNLILYIKELVAFLIISAMFAGIAFAIWFFAAPSGFYVINGVVYYNISPLALTALTVVSYLAISLYDHFTHKRIALGQDYRLLIDCGKGTAGLRTLYDTGHHVTDVFSGSSVAVVRYGAIETFLPEDLREAISLSLEQNNSSKYSEDENNTATATAVRTHLRMIPLHTVSGTGLLPAFSPLHINLVSSKGANADITGTYIAVCRILGRGEYDAIVGTDLVNLLERSGSFCREQ